MIMYTLIGENIFLYCKNEGLNHDGVQLKVTKINFNIVKLEKKHDGVYLNRTTVNFYIVKMDS